MKDKKYEKARAAFMDYVADYDMEDVMIRSKVTHTMRVAAFAERIARSIDMDDSDSYLAWMLGLLHDFGRFEQVRRFGTFIDSHSIDHAELGADLLFKEGYIDRFIEAGLPKEETELAETAIRQHNKLNLPEDLPERTKVFSQILRDADKVDIFRVLCELPFEQRAGKSIGRFVEKDEASPECMAYIHEHRCVPRALVQSRFEGRLSHICLAFELVYDESRRIAIEQGYLKKLFSTCDDNGNPIWSDKETIQLEDSHRELEKCWGITI